MFRQIPAVVVSLWSASGLVRATELCDRLACTFPKAFPSLGIAAAFGFGALRGGPETAGGNRSSPFRGQVEAVSVTWSES